MATDIAESTDVARSAGMLRCVVVTPEMTVLEEEAKFIAVPLFDGELGISPRRGSMIGRLGYGPLRLDSEGEKSTRFYIDGGFVQVADDVVTILTSRAIPVEEIDAAVAAEQLASARGRTANSDETFNVRDRLQAQARAQIRLAQQKKS